MQNPFRHHDRPEHPDFERDRDDARWQARDRRPDEHRTWSGGDGGRTAEAFRNQTREYGRDPYGPADAWTQDQYQGGSRYGRDHDRAGYARDYGQTVDRGPQYGYQTRQDYGRSYERQAGGGRYPDHGYAPGAQIWEGSGPGMGGQSHEHHDFEPDYLHWREQQLSAFDKDYTDWRNERRQKFSSDFDSWRSSRPRIQAENPIVGDVSDGGDGRGGEQAARKR